MEITVNLQLVDRVEQYEVDLIDIIAAYKIAKNDYLNTEEPERADLGELTFLVLKGLIEEQVLINENEEVIAWIADDNLEFLEHYAAKVTHVMEL